MSATNAVAHGKGPSRYPGLNMHHSDRDANLETESVVFGFWVFLMSDLIMFGVILATHITMATPMGTAGGPGPKAIFDLSSVLAQTLLLLLASLFYGLSSAASKYRYRARDVLPWMGATACAGAAFVWLGTQDLVGLAERGMGPSRSGFLSSYAFALGLHVLHICAALIWTGILIIQILVFGLAPLTIQTRQLRLGLMWHMLNIVWIGILSVVFLAGVA